MGKLSLENFTTEEREAIAEFVKKKLAAFADLKANQKEAEANYKLFLNHFFFVERGADGDQKYIALVKRAKSKEKTLVMANVNLGSDWTVMNVNARNWGNEWYQTVARRDEEVISSMCEFLFAKKLIVIDEVQDEAVGKTPEIESISENN